MHTLKDIQERFNWNYMPARKRVMWLKDNFKSEVKGGNNAKYQVTDNGLTILDRLKQLERNGIDLNSAFKQVKGEIQGDQSKDSQGKDIKGGKDSAKVDQKQDKSELNSVKRYIDRLESENDYLREKLDEKDRQLKEANETIQGLITGETEEEKEGEDEFKELGLIQVIKKWFTTKT